MILHLYAGNLFGGIETHLLNLLRADQLSEFQSDSRHAVALCFQGRLSAELSAINAPLFLLNEVRFRHPWTVWQARRQLRRIIRENNVGYLVAHASWAYRLGFPAAKSSGIPIAFLNHDILRCDNKFEHYAARHSPAKIITNSHFTADSCQKLFSRPADAVIHPATSITKVADRATARTKIRQELQTPENEVAIIHFSRFEQWKGHELLLLALGRLKDLPGWRLWLAGGVQKANEISYAKSLKRLSELLGISNSVQQIGQRTDIPEVLAAADIHCQPNLGPEPFGLAFVEALAAGLPSISTKIGGAAEIITPQCGMLVEPNNPEKLAEALKLLIQNQPMRASLGAHGPARAAGLCDPAIILRQLNQVLNQQIKI